MSNPEMYHLCSSQYVHLRWCISIASGYGMCTLLQIWSIYFNPHKPVFLFRANHDQQWKLNSAIGLNTGFFFTFFF